MEVIKDLTNQDVVIGLNSSKFGEELDILITDIGKAKDINSFEKGYVTIITKEKSNISFSQKNIDKLSDKEFIKLTVISVLSLNNTNNLDNLNNFKIYYTMSGTEKLKEIVLLIFQIIIVILRIIYLMLMFLYLKLVNYLQNLKKQIILS